MSSHRIFRPSPVPLAEVPYPISSPRRLSNARSNDDADTFDLNNVGVFAPQTPHVTSTESPSCDQDSSYTSPVRHTTTSWHPSFNARSAAASSQPQCKPGRLTSNARSTYARSDLSPKSVARRFSFSTTLASSSTSLKSMPSSTALSPMPSSTLLSSSGSLLSPNRTTQVSSSSARGLQPPRAHAADALDPQRPAPLNISALKSAGMVNSTLLAPGESDLCPAPYAPLQLPCPVVKVVRNGCSNGTLGAGGDASSRRRNGGAARIIATLACFLFFIIAALAMFLVLR